MPPGFVLVEVQVDESRHIVGFFDSKKEAEEAMWEEHRKIDAGEYGKEADTVTLIIDEVELP